MSRQKLGALFEESVLRALKSSFTDLIFLKEKYFFNTDSADFWPCTLIQNLPFWTANLIIWVKDMKK